ncbi:hypothetical protein NQ317_014169 [Molorchus minor]|uniref:Uncharacterized protein n=1 Tax=Molorchus minor TaxID=1323400 RepID=A0ABQ9IY71_9CUCU|nr:hypothetical protein NQ317_014169 [Molorchus minor]
MIEALLILYQLKDSNLAFAANNRTKVSTIPPMSDKKRLKLLKWRVKPILWDKSCEVLQPLRQPNSIQSSSERCESNMQWSIGLDSNTARENRNSHIKLDTSKILFLSS